MDIFLAMCACLSANLGFLRAFETALSNKISIRRVAISFFEFFIFAYNKRYKICSYSEEYFRYFYKEFKDSFSNIFFKHLSKYSNAKTELLSEPKRIVIDQPIVGVSLNRPRSSY